MHGKAVEEKYEVTHSTTCTVGFIEPRAGFVSLQAACSGDLNGKSLESGHAWGEIQTSYLKLRSLMNTSLECRDVSFK